MTATVAELKRAWRAVESGVFRDPAATPLNPNAMAWTPEPGEQVLPVVGAHGQSGASTLSLALATASAPARVVECALPDRCGLVAAPTAELGDYDGNWTRGLRGDVLVERVARDVAGCTDLPRPSVVDRISRLTVVDVSCDPRVVLASGGWLASVLTTSPAVLVTSTASVPGLRRLEMTLGVLDRPDSCQVALLGPARRKWPRGLASAFGPLTRAMDRQGRVIAIPIDPALRLSGVDSRPLPPALLSAAEQVLDSTPIAAGVDARKEVR